MQWKIVKRISKTKVTAVLAFILGILTVVCYLGIINEPNEKETLAFGILALTLGFYSLIRSKLKRRSFFWSLLGFIGIGGGIVSILSFIG